MRSSRRPGIRLYTSLTSLLLLIGCASENANSPHDAGILAAKGGPSGPKVSSTDPSSGDQGQRLNVRVLGAGYNATAVASWERNGAPDPKITVHSTTFVSASEVIADISIAADADTVLYDVAVEITASDGSRKKGVGIEKFEVRSGPHSANATVTATGAITTDGPQPAIVTDSVYVRMSRGTLASQESPFLSYFNFGNTHAAHAAAVRLAQPPCAYTKSGRPTGDEPGTADDDRRAALFSKLVDPTLLHRFAWGFTVYTPALGSASIEHSWQHHWNNPAGDSLFTMRSNDNAEIPGDPTVAQLAPNAFQFSGGTVRVIDRSGRTKDHIAIICPNLDAFVVTWAP